MGIMLVLLVVAIKYIKVCNCFCLRQIDRSTFSVSDLLLWMISTFGPLVFIPLSRASLIYFDCTRFPDGAYYLDAEPSQACFSSQWFSMLPLAACGLAVYVLGMPVLFAIVLYKKRHHLSDSRVLLRYGSLYSPFRTKYYWGGLLMMAKRLLVVSVSVFASQVQAWLFAGLLSIFLTSLVIINKTEPYRYHPLNGLESRLDLVVCTLVVAGLLFWTDIFPDQFSYSLCVVVALTAIAVAVISICLGLVRELHHQHECRTRVAPSDGRPAPLSQDRVFEKLVLSHAPDLQVELWDATTLSSLIQKHNESRAGAFVYRGGSDGIREDNTVVAVALTEQVSSGSTTSASSSSSSLDDDDDDSFSGGSGVSGFRVRNVEDIRATASTTLSRSHQGIDRTSRKDSGKEGGKRARRPSEPVRARTKRT